MEHKTQNHRLVLVEGRSNFSITTEERLEIRDRSKRVMMRVSSGRTLQGVADDGTAIDSE